MCCIINLCYRGTPASSGGTGAYIGMPVKYGTVTIPARLKVLCEYFIKMRNSFSLT